MSTINDLWYSADQQKWLSALENYWQRLRGKRTEQLEHELDVLNSDEIMQLDADGWYDFLLNRYFRWKYTAANRYATTSRELRRYEQSGRLAELHHIGQEIFGFDRENVREGLRIASQIRGLGIAGASGLVAVLFPQHFATVDQFVVRSLRKVSGMDQDRLDKINPEQLQLRDGVFLIEVMRQQARKINERFSTNSWTPRRIDMILTTYGR